MYKKFEQMIKERGLTVAEVSEATQIPQNVFSNWKSRGGNLSTANTYRLAKYLKISMEQLVGESEEDETDKEAMRDLDEYEAIHGADGALAQQRGCSAW